MASHQGGYLISQIKQRQGRVFEKLLAQAGIDAFNGAQGRILYVLWQQDGIPIVELAQKTGLAKTTLTSMLDRMEQANLIQRQYDPTDRRRIRITLTDATRQLQAQYQQVSEQMNDIFYAGMTDDEIQVFENTLRHVLDNIRRKE